MKTLTNPTDDELSAAVAEHVAGWKRIPAHGTWKEMWENESGSLELDGPWFVYSADAVLPWLEKWAMKSLFAPIHYTLLDGTHSIRLEGAATVKDKSFPRAACIALLRANGIEVNTK